MKTSLKLLSLLLAASAPAALAFEFAGIDLPAPVTPTTLFTGFCMVAFALIALADYARPSRVPSLASAASRRTPTKAAHPLAA